MTTTVGSEARLDEYISGVLYREILYIFLLTQYFLWFTYRISLYNLPWRFENRWIGLAQVYFVDHWQHWTSERKMDLIFGQIRITCCRKRFSGGEIPSYLSVSYFKGRIPCFSWTRSFSDNGLTYLTSVWQESKLCILTKFLMLVSVGTLDAMIIYFLPAIYYLLSSDYTFCLYLALLETPVWRPISSDQG